LYYLYWSYFNRHPRSRSAASLTKQLLHNGLLEQRFDALLSAQHIGQTIKELSSKPHHVGSPGGKEVAESILAKYKSWGWDAKIETYQVLFPTPKTRVLEMIAPTPFTAMLKENALKEDPSSGQEGTTANLQCLERRRRCNRRSCFCELWPAR
jgi:hypothetical protein